MHGCLMVAPAVPMRYLPSPCRMAIMSTDEQQGAQQRRPEARKPRGFPDRTAAVIAAERKLVDSISAVYQRWGFDALDTGPFEYVDALGKFLPDTDRPNAGVFAL